MVNSKHCVCTELCFMDVRTYITYFIRPLSYACLWNISSAATFSIPTYYKLEGFFLSACVRVCDVIVNIKERAINSQLIRCLVNVMESVTIWL